MPADSDRLLAARPTRRTESHRLRAFPGGYDIDRLPISVPREDGELLESWLHRTAYRYGLHPRAMLGELGVPVAPQRLLRMYDALGGDLGRTAAIHLGLDPEMLTRRSDLGNAMLVARTRYRTEFRLMSDRHPTRGARWCPHCLAERGCWQEAWAEPLVVYCSEHMVDLVIECPECRVVPYSTTAWATSLKDQTTCPSFIDDTSPGGARYRRRCETRFDLVRAREARDLAVSDQEFLLDLARSAAHEPDELVSACGVKARAQVVFEAVLEMVDQATGAPNLPVPAEATHTIVDVIRGAVEVLTRDSLRSGYQAARSRDLVWRTDALEVLGPKSSARMYARNPLITAMWLDSLRGTFSPSHELRFRMGSDRPRYPDGWQGHSRFLQARDARPGLPVAWIPQIVWPGTLELPGAIDLGLDTIHGRAFISMCLIRYGTTREWREIATCLGLPAWSAGRLQRIWRSISTADRIPDFMRALDDLFHRVHDSPPPIDYEARRSVLWDSESLRSSNLVGKLRAAQPTVAPFADVRRRFWSLYTGGGDEFAPPSYLDRRENLSSATAAPADAGLLVDAEQHLPEHLRAGPLTWAPP